MAKWTYKVTKHKVNGEPVKQDRTIQCDTEGSCLVHDLNEQQTNRLTEFFNKHGSEGWELVQCTYHEKELVCMWKKEI